MAHYYPPKVLQLMKMAGASPDLRTYTTLFGVYSKQAASVLADKNRSKHSEVDKRSFILKALALYFTMRVHKRDQSWAVVKTGLDMAAVNSLTQIVGLENVLRLSDEDVDNLQKQYLGIDGEVSSTNLEWTRLPLTKLRELHYGRCLPLHDFMPEDYFASQMTPVELLMWRDMAADGLQPDIITYNVLISQLATYGRLDQAHQYLNFVIESHHERVSPTAANSGATLRPQPFLPRQVNPKYYASLVRKTKYRRRPDWTPTLLNTDSDNDNNMLNEELASSEAADEMKSLKQVFAKSNTEAGEDKPFFLRTLWVIGKCYLHARRFDDFVTCYQLALSSYPRTARKCFRFLVRSWRDSIKIIPTTAATAETEFQIVLSRHGISAASFDYTHG